MYVRICVYVHMYVYMYAYMYICVCALHDYFLSLDIGFCDFETTSTSSFDIYSWAETPVGTTVTQRCNFGGQEPENFSNVTRTCEPSGWSTPDLSQCIGEGKSLK